MSFQWPVKILLVHPKAPFLMNERIIIAADCAALLNEELGQKFRNGGSVIIGCPLLEDAYKMADKIELIMNEARAREVEVYTMEVPCCHAIHMMVSKAIKDLGKDVKTRHYIVRVASRRAEPYRPGVVDESMIKAEREAHGYNHH